MAEVEGFIRHDVDPYKCLGCGNSSQGVHTFQEHARPIPGAFTICALCGTIHRLDSDSKRQLITHEDKMFFITADIANYMIVRRLQQHLIKTGKKPKGIIL